MADEKQIKRMQNLAAKRETLEGMIGIAQGLTRLEKAFQDVVIASRPSQRIPEKIKQYIAALNAKVRNLEDEPLVNRMDQIDQRLIKGVKKVLTMAEIENEEAIKTLPSSSSPKDFRRLFYAFKTSTQTTVALRAIAQGRGIPVEPIKLPLKQEDIYVKIERLKSKENHSREIITSGLKEFIADAEAIAYNERFPENMRDTAKEASLQMRENLELIETGKPFDELPNPFESITVDASDDSELYAEHDQQVSSSIDRENTKNESPKEAASITASEKDKKPIDTTLNSRPGFKTTSTPNNLWQRFNIWLNSSWKVSWTDTKYLDTSEPSTKENKNL